MMRRYSLHPIRGRRFAFTLLELVIGTGIAAILLAGLSSALFVALKTIEPHQGPTATHADTTRRLQSFLSELHFAASVEQYSPRSITFTIADRNEDGQPETLHYEWSGTPGDPLTVAVNGSSPIVVLPGLDELAFRDHTQSVSDDEGNARTVIVSMEIMLKRTESSWPWETMVLLLNRPEAPNE